MKPWQEMTDKEKNACIAQHIMGWHDVSKAGESRCCVEECIFGEIRRVFNLFDDHNMLQLVEDRIHDRGWSSLYAMELTTLLKGGRDSEPTPFQLIHAATEYRVSAMGLLVERMLTMEVDFDIARLRSGTRMDAFIWVAEHAEFIEGFRIATLFFHEQDQKYPLTKQSPRAVYYLHPGNTPNQMYHFYLLRPHH